MKLLNILRSPYWDLFPFVVLVLVVITEGRAYPAAGIGAVVWLFIVATRYLIYE